jgi:predicted patatin/cPLA2 family phospholipase
MSYRRFLVRRGPLIDLDYLYRHVYPTEIGFDADRIRTRSTPIKVTVTDARTGDGHYIDLRRVDVTRGLKATSAMPLVTEGPVRLNGGSYFDGGLTLPVPLEEPLRDGADDLVVVMNHHQGPRNSEPALASWLLGRRYPALLPHMRNHHAICERAEEAVNHVAEGVRVRVIRPQRSLGVGRFSRDTDRLHEIIERGRQDALDVLA